MACNVVVLAHKTAAAPELIDALVARKERGPIHATLVMPAQGPGSAARAAAKERLEAALTAWREAGISCDGVVGDSIPLQALADMWDPGRHDEVIVSTLPGQSSRWIRADLPHAVSRQTGVSVTHVIAQDPEERPEGGPPPEREKASLGPLSVLAWGGRHTEERSSDTQSSSRLPHGSSA
jgi:hypothetical protein